MLVSYIFIYNTCEFFRADVIMNTTGLYQNSEKRKRDLVDGNDMLPSRKTSEIIKTLDTWKGAFSMHKKKICAHEKISAVKRY